MSFNSSLPIMVIRLQLIDHLPLRFTAKNVTCAEDGFKLQRATAFSEPQICSIHSHCDERQQSAR